MSNRDCENFRESMNTEPSRENDNQIDYNNNTKAWAKHIFNIIPNFNDDDRDPIGDDRAD